MNAKLGLEALREPPKPALLALHCGFLFMPATYSEMKPATIPI